MYKSVLLVVVLFLGGFLVSAQDYSKGLTQFSGVVLEADSLDPIRFASIIIKNTNRGTISDAYGYFSFVAEKGDTIVFSSIGFQDAEYVIPDTISGNRYSLIQVMSTDTIELDEVTVFPWPSREEFKNAFMSLGELDEDLINAQNNLEMISSMDLERIEAMPYGSLNYKYQMQQYQSKLYYSGQYPVNNLMNPIAWASFIKSLKKKDK